MAKSKTSAKSSGKSSSKSSSSKRSSSLPNLGVDKNDSVEFRQIENGFIARRSSVRGKGRNQTWETKEYFTTENPMTKMKFSGKK